MLVSAGLALFVGFVSPDRWTILCLIAGIVAITLLITLQKVVSGIQRFSVRMDPRFALFATTIWLCAALSEIAMRLFLPQTFPDWNRRDRPAGEGLGFQYDSVLGGFRFRIAGR